MMFTTALATSLIAIGYGTSLVVAQSSYSDICSSYRREHQANVDGNFRVTYHCESQLSLPDTFHLAGTGIKDAEACARRCRDSASGCRGAVWSHKHSECWISTSDEGGNLIHAPDLLYIDPKDYSPGFEQCQKERERLQADLDKCKASVGDGGSGEKCPYSDLSRVTENGKTFKIYCKRLDDWGAANIRTFIAANAQACIQACSTTDGCTRAIWETKLTMKEPTGCWLRGWQGVSKVPTAASGYSSAHLQD